MRLSMLCLSLSVYALQMGKVHFGVLLGWTVVQSIVLWFMVNQIASNEAAEHRALDLYSCCCIVGYGMVPLLVLSVAVLFTPRCGGFGTRSVDTGQNACVADRLEGASVLAVCL